MSEHIKPMKIGRERFLEAVARLQLQTPIENDLFRERLGLFAKEYGLTPGVLMKGLSDSNIKSMRRGDAKVPEELPWLLVYFIFKDTLIDLTPLQAMSAFYALGFDMQLSIDVETLNPEDADRDFHDLKNLNFVLQEAKATAEDPKDQDFELDLRLGFDRVRLTVWADGLRLTGNRVAGELPLDPTEDVEPGYKGWFDLKFASSAPLSWFFDPKTEGKILYGRIQAEYLARVAAKRGSALIAEITARREALKVRIVDDTEQLKPSKSLADRHRDKMCEAIARRSFAGSADEFVLLRISLVAANRD